MKEKQKQLTAGISVSNWMIGQNAGKSCTCFVAFNEHIPCFSQTYSVLVFIFQFKLSKCVKCFIFIVILWCYFICCHLVWKNSESMKGKERVWEKIGSNTSVIVRLSSIVSGFCIELHYATLHRRLCVSYINFIRFSTWSFWSRVHVSAFYFSCIRIRSANVLDDNLLY